MKVTVELDEKQAYIVMEALEFYSRIKMGQFDQIHSILWQENYELFKDVDMILVRNVEDTLKRVIFPNLDISAYYGIHSKQSGKFAKIAWDIYQKMRYDVAWARNPKGGAAVDFQNPDKVGELDLPTVNVDMER